MEGTAAHTAIGRAICASQHLETILVLSFEFFRMVNEPEYRAITSGYIDPKSFKTPLKNLLKHLAERNQIDPVLGADMEGLLEKRLRKRLSHYRSELEALPSVG